MKKTIRQRVRLLPGMKVKFLPKDGLSSRPRVFTVVEVRHPVVQAWGSGQSFVQNILRAKDRHGLTEEHDLANPLWIKNKNNRWVKRHCK